MLAIYTVAFFSGLAVMAIELSASRLIAPYFGTSLFVWTNVIAVILAALALGYYLGGRLSERAPRLTVLLKLILAAGILLAFIPYIVKPIATQFALDVLTLSSASAVVMLGSFLLTVALFFVPITLLGMVSPYLIKIVSLARRDMGNVSGRIFAVSTIGSIIGTFLPALIFIPWIGTKFTMLVFAAVLIVIGLLGLLPRKLFVVIPLIGIPFGALDTSLKPVPGLIAEAESSYQYLQVIEDRARMRYLIYNEGGGVQSVYHPDRYFYGGQYFDFGALLPALRDGKRVLAIGLAGGTIARTMHALYGDDPGFHIDGVEIDRSVIELGRKFFALENPSLSVIEADGRTVVDFGSNEYDVIFIDAYTNQIYIPFHLTTQEFFKAVRERLTPGGIVGMNVNASSEDSRLLRAISNTLASVFPHVYRLQVGDFWNYMMVASETPIDFERLKTASFPLQEFTTFAPAVPPLVRRVTFDPTTEILTDDRAPIEHMTDAMIWDYVRRQLRR